CFADDSERCRQSIEWTNEVNARTDFTAQRTRYRADVHARTVRGSHEEHPVVDVERAVGDALTIEATHDKARDIEVAARSIAPHYDIEADDATKRFDVHTSQHNCFTTGLQHEFGQ